MSRAARAGRPVGRSAGAVRERKEHRHAIGGYGTRRTVGRQNLSLAWREMQRQSSKRREIELTEEPVRSLEKRSPSRVGLVFEKLIMPAVKRKHFVSDTGRLNYPLMREMLASIRQRAQASGLAQVPVVLTNHPKDIRDLPAIERLNLLILRRLRIVRTQAGTKGFTVLRTIR